MLDTAHFLTITNLFPEPVLLLSCDGTILATNRAAQKLFLPEALAGGSLYSLISCEREKAEKFLSEAGIAGDFIPTRLNIATVDGSLACTCRGARISPGRMDDPILVRIEPAATITHRFLDLNLRLEELNNEVARRRMLEEELRRKNEELLQSRDEALTGSRLKSCFLANMSHELRTPLNAIIGYSEMLKETMTEDRAEDMSFKRDLENILESARHLLDLVSGVLDIARIEANQISIVPQHVEVRSIIESVVGAVTPDMLKRQNTLKVRVAEGVTDMKSEAVKIRQILLNLLGNASKFTRGGVVELDVQSVLRDGDDWISFRVSDNGIGIPREDQGRLFRAFVQLDPTSTRKYGGAGLGLYITRKLCELLGGSIEVDSEPGRGSTFTVMLPRIALAGEVASALITTGESQP